MGDRKKRITCSALRATIFVFLLLMSGCGYSIHRQTALPGGEISVGLIENKTVEPKLQDKLNRALTEEFVKQGIRVTPAAPYKLTGVINSFDMISLSEKEGISVEYRIIVTADFRLSDAGGKVVMTKNVNSPFIVALTASEDLGGLLAAKEVLEQKAMADLAMEIAGAVIFR